jgi:GrpB-like predicted nucleotidyltransferase (UPF0157 family)
VRLSESGAGRDRIEVVSYDPRWPALFEAEATRLRRALGKVARRIEHIGSTSVPGLAAKPVIDIQISVPALEPAAPYADPLEELGYGNWRDVHDPGHRFCRDEPRCHHVHLVISGRDVEVARPLFRDYLAAHPEVAQEYAELRLSSAAALGHDREAYTNSKDQFIKKALSAARLWAEETAWVWGTPKQGTSFDE